MRFRHPIIFGIWSFKLDNMTSIFKPTFERCKTHMPVLLLLPADRVFWAFDSQDRKRLPNLVLAQIKSILLKHTRFADA